MAASFRPAADDPEDWTAPGAYPVAPGVLRIPLPLPNDGLRAVNVYAIDDGERLVLVDSGWAIPGGREALEKALAAADRSLGDIARFLVTHLHRDHYSLAIAIRRELGTPVSLGAGEEPSLRIVQQPDHPPLEPQLQQLVHYGATDLVAHIRAARAAAPPHHLDWASPDQWLTPGTVALERGRNLEVIETPGHTRGHVVFFDHGGGLLFAGDHVLPTITPSIGFEPAVVPDPLGAFLGSLAKVRQLPDATLLPAHGPVAPSVHRRIDELVEHHGRRLDQTEAAVTAGADTVVAVAARLRWTRRERHLDELDPFNQMLAVTETGAHLTLLCAQGRVVRVDDEDGLQHYTPG